MPLVMIPPQVAFTVSVGDSEVSVYHVYSGQNFDAPTTYWYTFDEDEEPDNEFDIRELPNWSKHPHGTSFDVLLQDALDRVLVRINNNQLTTVGGE
jgi:hypothetical protein